jgi:LacI family transcriptional regulator
MNLRELSKHLNLSQTTVSRALNGYPEVNEATRKRVAEAARKFHYRPNVRARTLATGRAMSIGHVIPMSQQNELVNMIFADFIAGAGLVYAQNGYTMTLNIVKDEDELSAYSAFNERGAVDGVIVQAPTRNDRRIAYLAALDLPFVVHGRASDITSPYAWLDVNNTRAIRTATEYLMSLGHRRIALVNGRDAFDFALRRRDGYLAALTSAGLEVDHRLISSGDMSEPRGFDVATDLLALDQPPTAFIASSIVLALGIRRALEQQGKTMGKDVSVVCYDDDLSYLPNAGDVPIFTAMRSSVRAAGARCAAMLIEAINDPDAGPATELWEAELIIGTSTGPAPETT